MDTINALKLLRLESNTTQAMVAAVANTSVQTILKHEQGLYGNPSPKVIDAYKTFTQRPVAELEDMYAEWRTRHRWENRFQIIQGSNRFVIAANFSGLEYDAHPHAVYRNTVVRYDGSTGRPRGSLMEYCKLLCLHPAQINTIEKRAKDVHLPPSIKIALDEAGVYFTAEIERKMRQLND